MDGSPRLERLLQRDTLIVGGVLGIVSLLSWSYVLRLAGDMTMPGMDMNGLRMVSTGWRLVSTPAHSPWTAAEFALMFVMWAVMMIGMMTPSASPLVLLYARVARQAVAEGKTFAAVGWCVAGYLTAWVLFALVATTVQWGLERAALLSVTMAAASRP